jgi:hypothetical protein
MSVWLTDRKADGRCCARALVCVADGTYWSFGLSGGAYQAAAAAQASRGRAPTRGERRQLEQSAPAMTVDTSYLLHSCWTYWCVRLPRPARYLASRFWSPACTACLHVCVSI